MDVLSLHISKGFSRKEVRGYDGVKGFLIQIPFYTAGHQGIGIINWGFAADTGKRHSRFIKEPKKGGMSRAIFT